MSTVAAPMTRARGAALLATLVLNDGIPCGGLGGNEFNKIKHAIDAVSTNPALDPAVAIKRMTAKLTELDFSNSVEPFLDYQLVTFFDGTGSGEIQIHPSGDVSVDAETKCLDNPDQ